MKNARAKDILNSEAGIAVLETIPLLVIFVMLISFALGMFGIVHTAVLQNIAARTYSFETFRQRSNLYYFREDGTGLSRPLSYEKKGWRFQAVQNESDPRDRFVATVRPISFGNVVPEGDMTEPTNNVSVIGQLQQRNQKISVNPAWIMVGYGICLNAGCGN